MFSITGVRAVQGSGLLGCGAVLFHGWFLGLQEEYPVWEKVWEHTSKSAMVYRQTG